LSVVRLKLIILKHRNSDNAMVLTKDDHIPTYEELKVEEVPLGSPYLKAGAFHLGKHCENTNNEYMLCRQENNDPRYGAINLLQT